MSSVKKLSMVTAGAAFIALGTFSTDPATAALLEFDFTTENGATGSFTLNTDIPPANEPANFGIGIGLSYPNAVSDFSFSAPYISPLNSVTADYDVAPSIPLAPGVVLSGVSYPSGCSRATIFNCLINVAVFYSGNVPELSDDPLFYPRGLGIDVFDPTTSQLIFRDDIVNFEIVPEPDSVLGTLAVGIGGASLLLKRKMNKKKAAIKL